MDVDNVWVIVSIEGWCKAEDSQVKVFYDFGMAKEYLRILPLGYRLAEAVLIVDK